MEEAAIHVPSFIFGDGRNEEEICGGIHQQISNDWNPTRAGSKEPTADKAVRVAPLVVVPSQQLLSPKAALECTHTHKHTHFQVQGLEKGVSENEAPGPVGAYTTTHNDTITLMPNLIQRISFTELSHTHTHTHSFEFQIGPTSISERVLQVVYESRF